MEDRAADGLGGAWALVLVALVACNDGSSRSADAGVDADWDADVGFDAADAAEVDVRDAEPDDPQFRAIEDLPERCVVLQAHNPAAIPPHRFEPCLDGRHGCEQLVVDWGEFGGFRVYQPQYWATQEALLVHRVPFDSDGHDTIVARPDGTIIGAIRSSPRCAVTNAFATDAETYTMGLFEVGPETGSFVVRGSWGTAADVVAAIPTGGRGSRPSAVAMHETTATLLLGSGRLTSWSTSFTELVPTEAVAGSVAFGFVTDTERTLFLFARGLHYKLAVADASGARMYLEGLPTRAVYAFAYDEISLRGERAKSLETTGCATAE